MTQYTCENRGNCGFAGGKRKFTSADSPAICPGCGRSEYVRLVSSGFGSKWMSVGIIVLAVLAVYFFFPKPSSKPTTPARLLSNKEAEPVPPIGSESFGVVSKASQDDWADFREKQHFHNQMVAMTDMAADKTRTLIISEPPPNVVWDDLAKTLRPYAKGCAIKQHNVMFNGWVYDVVCTLKPAEHTELSELVANLHFQLFETVQDAHAVKLPVPPTPILGPSLDYQFSGGDLYRWLIEQNIPFQPLALSSPVALSDIMANKLRGVFVTPTEGLVLWVIDRGGLIDGEGANIRRFALEGDIILGAVADRDSLALVARKRVETTARLPPLRVETVKLLAGIQQSQIQQSYERNHFLAGKGTDEIDRAPILLSPELVDTELGSLLNITDQLLKGWSEAGQISYQEFPYPKPSQWPFGEQPASSVEDRKEFLFNWNTDGTSYAQTIGNYEFVLPQRTGSLSIIYGDVNNRPRAMEDKAYDYYAKIGDANIARVLQYSTIYQIFQHFHIAAVQPDISKRYDKFKLALNLSTEKTLRAIPSLAEDKQAPEKLRRFHPDSPEDRLDSVVNGDLAYATELGNLFNRNGFSMPDFVDALANPRDVKSTVEQGFISNANELQKKLPRGLIALANESAGTWESLESVDAKPRSRWIRTAYVVASSPADEMTGKLVYVIGGHNIDAPLTQMKASNQVMAGSISVERDNQNRLTVFYNDKDKGRLREISRLVGTRKQMDPTRIAGEVNKELAKTRTAPKPVMLAALSERTPAHADIPAFIKVAEIKPGMVRSYANENQLRVLAATKDIYHPTLSIEQMPDGTYQIMTTASREVISVTSVPGMTEALIINMLRGANLGSPVHVIVREIDPAKAQAIFAHVSDIIRRLPPDSAKAIVLASEGSDIGAAHLMLANYRIARNDIKIDPIITKRNVNDGPYKGSTELTINIELPPALTSKSSVLLNVFFYAKRFTQQTIDSITRKLNYILKNGKTEISPFDLMYDIKHELEQDFKDIGVDTIIFGAKYRSNKPPENYDIYISGQPKNPFWNAALVILQPNG